MDILGGLAVFAVLSLVSAHSAEIQKDSGEGARQKLDSTIARLLQMQFRRKFKRQGTDDILRSLDQDSLSAYDYNNPLKRTVYDASDFGPKQIWKGYYPDRKLEEIEDLLRNELERRRRWP